MAVASDSAPSSITALRTLSLHERYCVARDNVGMSPQLCALASGRARDKDDLAALDLRIAKRIAALLDLVPALSCFVADAQAVFPRFAIRTADRGGSFEADDVLLRDDDRDWTEIVSGLTELEERHSALQAKAIEWQCKNLRLELGKPLWRVRIVRSDLNFTIVLMLHHALADGRSLINLLALLVAPYDAPMPDQAQLAGTIALQGDRLPPRSEDTMPFVKPPFWVLALMLAREIILPLLPIVLQRLFGVQSSWPAGSRQVHSSADPLQAPISGHVVMLQGSTTEDSALTRMRANCAAHDVQSIHPAVHTACLLSLRAALLCDSKDRSSSERTVVKSDTPMSARDPRTQGTLTGNFVGVLSDTRVLPHQTERVWDVTRAYAARLNSHGGRVTSQRIWSLLPIAFSEGRMRAYDARRKLDAPPTLWEEMLQGRLDKARQGTAALGSLELSNPGMVTPVDERIAAVSWTQHASALASTINVDVLRWRCGGGQAHGKPTIDGLTLSVNIRKEVFLSARQEACFVDYLRGSLQALRQGRWSADSTVEQMDKLVSVQSA